MADSVSATVVLPAQAAPAQAAPAQAAPAAAAPAAAAPAAGTPAFSIPDSFKDKPYLKGIDTPEKLFSMLDGAQTLIGQRPAGIPAPDAPAEEWGKFYDALGRPKTSAEYQLEIDPSVKPDEKVVGQIKDLFYKHGLTPAQAKGIQKDFDAMAIAVAKEKGIQLQQQNTDFDKLAGTVFGPTRDADLATAKQLIDTFAPPAMKGEIAKMSNENLILMAGVLKGISAKYIKADGAPSSQSRGTGQSPDDLRAEGRKLMESDAWKNSMHLDHEKTKARVAELYRLASGGK